MSGTQNHASEMPAATPRRASASGMELAVLWQGIRQRKAVLFLVVCGAISLGVLYIKYADPVYDVTSRLLVQGNDNILGEYRSFRSDEEEFLATQAEIISSPAVVSDAVMSSDFPLESIDSESDTDPVLFVLKRLNVDPIYGTNVLKLDFSGQSEAQAVAIVSSILESYERFTKSATHDEFREMLVQLTNREEELRGDIQGLEDQLLQLRDDSPLIGEGYDRSSVEHAILTHLGRTLVDAKSERLDLENQYQVLTEEVLPKLAGSASIAGNEELLTSTLIPQSPVRLASSSGARVVPADLESQYPDWALDTPRFAPSGNSTLERIRLQLFETIALEKELSQRYGPEHPDIQATKEQIEFWDVRLQDALAAASIALEQQVETAQLREERLTQLYSEEAERVDAAEKYLVREQQLRNRITRTQEIHDTILVRLQEMKLADSSLVDGGSELKMTVLQAPALVRGGISPPPLIVLVICAFAGLIGGVALIALEQQFKLARDDYSSPIAV
ncbi:MAG: hypothetical protein DWQ29_18345 [Planctomycetota bacterium]|nr:MAG: hypothetical protein DWQ29_18345 [Planctomycetota bacterium]